MNYQEKLIDKVISGDEKAFEEIYKSTYKKVHFTCRAFLKNENDVADIEQEIYITVLNSLETLQDKSKFESWLGKITVNKCRDYMKKKNPVLVEDEIMAEVLEEDNELKLPEEYVSNKAKRKILMDIIRECLSDTLYQTVILFYFNDMSATEIAEIMECPVGTITSRLCLARGKIKEGILAYEKKSGDKLHGIVLVPVLGLLFKEEAMAMEPQILLSNIVKNSSTKLNTVRVAESGGKAMFKTLKMKILVGLTATALVGGGVTVTVLNQSEKKAETTIEQSMDKETEKTDSGKNQKDDEVSLSAEGGSDKDAGGDNSEVEKEEAVPEVTKIGTKVVDNELVTIEYAGAKWDESKNYRIYFNVTNKIDEQVGVETNREFVINGYHENPGKRVVVEPNESAEMLLLISDYFLSIDKIEHVDFMEVMFLMRPQETGGITYEKVQIIPEDSKNGAVSQKYLLSDTDEVVLDTDEYFLVIKGYRILEKYDELELDYYFLNKSNKDVCININGMSTLNGTKELGLRTSGMDDLINAGYGINEKISAKRISEIMEGDIESIEAELAIYNKEYEYDAETSSRKVVSTHPFTIKKVFENN